CAGRSKGTPTMSVPGQIPWRSGSPHGVFGGAYGVLADGGACADNVTANARPNDANNPPSTVTRPMRPPTPINNRQSPIINRSPIHNHYINNAGTAAAEHS